MYSKIKYKYSLYICEIVHHYVDNVCICTYDRIVVAHISIQRIPPNTLIYHIHNSRGETPRTVPWVPPHVKKKKDIYIYIIYVYTS